VRVPGRQTEGDEANLARAVAHGESAREAPTAAVTRATEVPSIVARCEITSPSRARGRTGTK
jgi:hypothetical protein